MEVRKQYQIEITNRIASSENLSDVVDLNRACENIKENMKTPAKESLCLHELEQHKPCFGEEGSRFLHQRKRAKMQWLQYPNQSDVVNLRNVRSEDSRRFRK